MCKNPIHSEPLLMGVKLFFNNKVVEAVIVAVSLGIILICIYTPDVILLKHIAHYTVHFMLLFLFLGLFFLMLDNKRLLLWNFAFASLLSLFLKSSSNTNLQLAKDSGFPEVKVALINLSNISQDPGIIPKYLNKANIDIIAFNELTPNWDPYLKEQLLKSYPYMSNYLSIDNFGKAIYSKLPISQSDTLYHDGIPYLMSYIELGSDQKLVLLNAYFLPPLTRRQIAILNSQLGFLIQEIRQNKFPLICLGDFNLAPWSNELRAFKYSAKLNDSRRDIIPRAKQDLTSFLDVPVEHITFNNRLSCTVFENIYDAQDNYIGIMGQYQLTNSKEEDLSILLHD